MKKIYYIIIIGLLFINFVYADSGGVATVDGSYTVVTFNNVGSFSYNTSSAKCVEILVVAGGGGGGRRLAGGGGAGGLIHNISYCLTAETSYTVIVGAGGNGATSDGNGQVGQNTTFGTLIASGGGYGAGYPGWPGGNGGCGGGGMFDVSPNPHNLGGSGLVGQGYNGGAGNTYAGGGGGGAGSVGQDAQGAHTGTDTGGNGGAGYLFLGSYYAGGGGGGGYEGGGDHGLGVNGGGDGSKSSDAAIAATANTGGGGGGGGQSTGGIGGNGGDGGSGIVIIRYMNCVEDWIINNSLSCDGITKNYKVIYNDNNYCETNISLPLNNGTIIDCTIIPQCIYIHSNIDNSFYITIIILILLIYMIFIDKKLRINNK